MGTGVLALTGAGLLLAPSASADAPGNAYTVQGDGANLVFFRAGAGTTNSLHVTYGGQTQPEFVVTLDDVAPIEAGEGCVHPDASDQTRVVCTVVHSFPDATGGYQPPTLRAVLGDGADDATLRGGVGHTIVYGGMGDDVLTSDGFGSLDGEWGTDSIFHAASASGGPGNDTIVAQGLPTSGSATSASADGGDGTDFILGGTGDEVLHGGRGNDVIYGRYGDDVIRGDEGADRLHGGKGFDHLFGAAGADELHGDSGGDWLSGGDDDDRLFGGGGDDELHGNAGTDELNGGAGSNIIEQ